MRPLFLATIAVLATPSLLAQPDPVWSSSISTNFSWYVDDKPQVKIDGAGDLVVVGNTNTLSNGRDILVIKYSSEGDLLWQQTFNGSANNDDVARDFAIDDHDNIVITGATRIDSLNTDCLTLKYDPSGTWLWANTFDGEPNREDAARAISIDPSGASFITGYAAIDTLGHNKLFAAKIDSVGNTSWTYLYGADTVGFYTGEKVMVRNEDVHILGSYLSYPQFENKYVVFRLDTNGTASFAHEGALVRPAQVFHQDGFGNSYLGFGAWERFKIVKVDVDGLIAWSDTIGTNLPPNHTADQVRAIVVDPLQNVYITGRHNGDDYSGPTYSNADIVTVKYTSNGERSWVRRYEYQGNNAADIGNAIALDDELNVYVAGQSGVSLSDYDYVVLKYDNDGNDLGTIRYNDPAGGDDVITSIVVADGSAIYVTGLTYEDPLSSTTTQKYSSLSGTGVFDPPAPANSLNSFPNPFKWSTTVPFVNPNKEAVPLSIARCHGQADHGPHNVL
ncbi:MAG: hypothetical protein R2818_15850 [Flavobacteriales bacterium]